MILSFPESVIFLYIEKGRALLYLHCRRVDMRYALAIPKNREFAERQIYRAADAIGQKKRTEKVKISVRFVYLISPVWRVPPFERANGSQPRQISRLRELQIHQRLSPRLCAQADNEAP